MKFKHLFSPIKIGNMTVKNRILMPGMGVNFGCNENNGHLEDQIIQFLAARAKGGTGMIIMAGGAIDPTGMDVDSQPMMWRDDIVPSIQKLADAIHPHGAKIGMHLYHSGGQRNNENKVGPSPVAALAVVKGAPRELTVPEIKDYVKKYGESALKCKQGGLDFVEVHAAHGYLISEFFSPYFNQRTDEYGGSFENRVRFMLEIADSIRDHVGNDIAFGVRINGDDYMKGGWGLDDAKRLAPLLEQHGVDYVHVSAGVYGTAPLTIAPMYEDDGYLVYLAEAIKKEVSIPVCTVGRIKDPAFADKIIAEGKADFVAIGRPHIADPEFANKAMEGRLQDIRPCLGCCLGCIERVLNDEPASCVVNPEVGREYSLTELKKVDNPKNVLIVGAGPTGLHTAMLLGKRGHKVTILEENDHVGGNLKAAGKPPKRAIYEDFLEYLRREVSKQKVEIRLNTEVTEEVIDEIKPDVAVVCSGSKPAIPLMKGLFTSDMDVHTAVDILEGKTVTGDKVMVLGNNNVSLMVADYLAERGKEVVVLGRKRTFGEEMSGADRFYLRTRLAKAKVKLMKNVSVKKFVKGGVLVTVDGTDAELSGYDDVVISEGMDAVRKPAELFKKKDVEVHVIGDAKSPKNLMDCIAEADDLGRSL
ncbi:MAG: FAD-dependent oxidoreductase [Desulfobacterales bacterium]|jgi:2,4-dienoyl-CoA reductase-like NADH-dependent reductase (Old Yellow Enzyme family)/ribulose 1,5-bisphosphate synthetase/thiazole synthase|nr:FAD-dependent oxidoreductase [Desulfobacterales bacterium]